MFVKGSVCKWEYEYESDCVCVHACVCVCVHESIVCIYARWDIALQDSKMSCTLLYCTTL